ncbi:TPA: hypothetical protein NGS33_003406 [Vibrio parahaemolyticus]|uniref:hypothetical protein n=1 Tax=Vibrio parahaemolyticus TaxID=670 RepID=UPI0015DFDAF7|nr:hypothetical protein [Vibrio parahaemolyticus]HCE1745705.1 hypothetical protein [Vibrio parahaemolyticus]
MIKELGAIAELANWARRVILKQKLKRKNDAINDDVVDFFDDEFDGVRESKRGSDEA